VVAKVSVNNLQIVHGAAEESVMLSSFWFVSVEEVIGTAKLKGNVCNSFPSCDVVVCVSESVTGSAKANVQHFSLCCAEVQIESASVTLSEMNSWSSCCSLSDCRCGHESCVKDSLRAAEVQVLVWAYS
jgi:hypothetical protein